MVALAALLAAAAGVVLTAAGGGDEDGDPRLAGHVVGTDAGQALLDAVPPGPALAADHVRIRPTAAAPGPPPLPEALPAMAHAPTPQIVLGSLELPTLGVVGQLQEGMTLTAINRGPSHWPGTALPGERGNAVIAGHRTTYSRPFHDLDLLQPGDPVVFRLKTGEVHTYAVRDVIVVPEAAIGIATQTSGHTATLFACHPKGSASHRIVAKLALLGPDGAPVDDEAELPPVDVGLRPGDDVLLVRDPAGPAPLTDPLADRLPPDLSEPVSRVGRAEGAATGLAGEG